MKPQRKQIEDLLSEKPLYKHRKFRYNVVSEILERYYGLILAPSECQLICSLADEYRHQTEADEIGLSKEKDWRPTTEFKQEETRLFKLSQITAL